MTLSKEVKIASHDMESVRKKYKIIKVCTKISDIMTNEWACRPGFGH